MEQPGSPTYVRVVWAQGTSIASAIAAAGRPAVWSGRACKATAAADALHEGVSEGVSVL